MKTNPGIDARAGLTALFAFCMAMIMTTSIAWAGEELVVGENWQINTQRETWSVTSGTQVTMVNPLGDIRTRPSPNDILVVQAVVQTHTEDPREFSFELEMKEDGSLFFNPGFVATDGATVSESIRAFDSKRRVDLALRVPTGIELNLTTASGLIEVKEHSAAVNAKTTSGRLLIMTSGPVQSENGDGPSSVVFSALNGQSHLSSTGGELKILLPQDPDVLIEGRTQGWITSDFSMQVGRDSETGNKHATVKLGQGQSLVTLNSIRGDLLMLSTGVVQGLGEENP